MSDLRLRAARPPDDTLTNFVREAAENLLAMQHQGVYNWTDDTDDDGSEDLLKQDLRPEPTAFCQIGILRLIAARQQRAR